MIAEVFSVVSAVTFVAEVRFAEKTSERITSVVMFIFFDETNDLTRRCGWISIKDDHIRRINGHDLDLVLGQGGSKSFKFGDTARSFGDSSESVKFLGQSLFDGTALFEIVVVLVSSISVSVRQSFHRDDGACTSQVILIFDGDARFFHDTANGNAARFVSFTVSTAWSRGAYEGCLYGKSVVGGELFVGIEFASESLEIRI